MARAANRHGIREPAQEKGAASALVKILDLVLRFVEEMCGRWEKGDYFGAILRLGGATEGILLAALFGVLLVHLKTNNFKDVLYTILIPMVLLPVGIMFGAPFWARDDTRLAAAQAMRVHRINPKSMYQAA
jgi:hypothetical protein